MDVGAGSTWAISRGFGAGLICVWYSLRGLHSSGEAAVIKKTLLRQRVLVPEEIDAVDRAVMALV